MLSTEEMGKMLTTLIGADLSKRLIESAWESASPEARAEYAEAVFQMARESLDQYEVQRALERELQPLVEHYAREKIVPLLLPKLEAAIEAKLSQWHNEVLYRVETEVKRVVQQDLTERLRRALFSLDHPAARGG